jgi:hypothetical protein
MPDSSGVIVLDDLPEVIIVEEILMWLPAEGVLHCHAVRRSWCCATSTHEFMLAHHRHQPSLPIIHHILLGREDDVEASHESRLVAFRCEATADPKLSPVIRCANPSLSTPPLMDSTLSSAAHVSTTCATRSPASVLPCILLQNCLGATFQVSTGTTLRENTGCSIR